MIYNVKVNTRSLFFRNANFNYFNYFMTLFQPILTIRNTNEKNRDSPNLGPTNTSAKKKKKKEILLQILSEHSDKVVTRMTFHALDRFPIQRMISHLLQPSSIAVCRASSFFGRNARWNLHLSSSLSNRKPKNNL